MGSTYNGIRFEQQDARVVVTLERPEVKNTPGVRIGNPEGQLGILAAASAAWRLPELIGEPLAKEIMLAGQMLAADEALAVRLLTKSGRPTRCWRPPTSGWTESCETPPPCPAADEAGTARTPRDPSRLRQPGAAILFETDEKQQRMDAFLARRRNR